jgi:polyisoprenoid-binding protein YceI
MKKLSLVAAVAVSALLFAFKPIAPSTWTVDKAHARLTISITHMSVSDVEGSFKIFDATVNAPGDDFANATVDFTADAASINTDNEARDKHIKTDAFLDVAKYPTVNFKSTSFKKLSENTYAVAGNLTLHGVTKPVTLTAVTRMGMSMKKTPVAGFKITGNIKRSDFGIAPNFPSMALSDEIAIAANAEFGKN